jgi:hypothetical protein
MFPPFYAIGLYHKKKSLSSTKFPELNLDKLDQMWYNITMTNIKAFYTYLKRRLRFHESMIAVVEHSQNADELERQRLLRDQLEDIIHHFEEFVKDGMDDQ